MYDLDVAYLANFDVTLGVAVEPVMEEADPRSQGLLEDQGGGLFDEDPDDLLKRKPVLGVVASFIHSGRLSFCNDLRTRSSASEGVRSTTALRRSFSGTCNKTKQYFKRISREPATQGNNITNEYLGNLQHKEQYYKRIAF